MSGRLPLLRWQACQAIDRKAGEVRLRFVSACSGQEAVHQAKRTEAQAYLAAFAVDPEAVPGPHLAAEAVRRAMSAEDLAEEVLAASAAWLLGEHSPAIEAERVGGKADVRAAADAPGIADALADCLAALEEIVP